MNVSQSLAQLAGRLLRPVRAGDDKLANDKQARPEGVITIRSTSFESGQPIPEPFAGVHGRSPALSWQHIPEGTRELALLCEDPDAPTPKPFVHWLVLIPPTVTELPEGLPPSSVPLTNGVVQGRNSMMGEGYMGPAPPPGHGTHHYHFQLFALDARPNIDAPAGRAALLEAMRGHVIGFGELMGTYER